MVLILSLLPLGFRVLQILAPSLMVYMVATFVLAACYMALYIAAFSLGLPTFLYSFNRSKRHVLTLFIEKPPGSR